MEQKTGEGQEMQSGQRGGQSLIIPRQATPDAVNVAWPRLVVPSEAETSHARWETDPTWRVIQAAQFTPAPAQARRLIRRTEHARCAEQLDGILYGLLVRRVAELHPEGEQWDVSRALGEVAPNLAELATQPEKDFGQRVRVRRQELGLPVAPASKVLPLRASPPPLEPPEALAALDAEPPETEQERAAWHVFLAERRMREAHLALEQAEQRGVSPRVGKRLAAAFEQAVACYGAAQAACAAGLVGAADVPHGSSERAAGEQGKAATVKQSVDAGDARDVREGGSGGSSGTVHVRHPPPLE